jgi:hypothetical protein
VTNSTDAGDGDRFQRLLNARSARRAESRHPFPCGPDGDWSRGALYDSHPASFQAPALIPLAPIFVCMRGWSGKGKDWATNIAILIAVCLAACGDDNSQQARETLVSWSKSLELLEQQRTQRRVPEVYVRQMVRAATSALNQQREQLSGDLVVRDVEIRIQRLTRCPTPAPRAEHCHRNPSHEAEADF